MIVKPRVSMNENVREPGADSSSVCHWVAA